MYIKIFFFIIAIFTSMILGYLSISVAYYIVFLSESINSFFTITELPIDINNISTGTEINNNNADIIQNIKQLNNIENIEETYNSFFYEKNKKKIILGGCLLLSIFLVLYFNSGGTDPNLGRHLPEEFLILTEHQAIELFRNNPEMNFPHLIIIDDRSLSNQSNNAEIP